MERLYYKEYGFNGYYYKNEEAKRAIIVLGGQSSLNEVATKVSKRFYDRGFTALGILYYNSDELPDTLYQVPLDQFDEIIKFLHQEHYKDISIYGIGKGGELALLIASLFNEDIKDCIALSPSHVVWEGLRGRALMLNHKSFHSEFTYKGKDIPFTELKLKYYEIIKNYLKNKEMSARARYIAQLDKLNLEAIIPAYKIKGGIMLIYSKNDLSWPSDVFVNELINYLKDNNFKNDLKVLEENRLGHLMAPIDPKLKKFGNDLDKIEIEREIKEEVFIETIKFLNRNN
jgi:esterase/lipase